MVNGNSRNTEGVKEMERMTRACIALNTMGF